MEINIIYVNRSDVKTVTLTTTKARTRSDTMAVRHTLMFLSRNLQRSIALVL